MKHTRAPQGPTKIQPAPSAEENITTEKTDAESAKIVDSPNVSQPQVPTFFWCKKREARYTLINCLRCTDYPCRQVSKEDQKVLLEADETRIHRIYWDQIGVKAISVGKDGLLKEFTENLKSPGRSILDIKEVFVVKVMKPRFTLKIINKEGD